MNLAGEKWETVPNMWDIVEKHANEQVEQDEKGSGLHWSERSIWGSRVRKGNCCVKGSLIEYFSKKQ